MAWKLTEAYVQIGADDSKLQKDVDSAMDRLSSRLSSWGVKLSAIGATILGGAGFLAKLGMQAVESDNLFEVSFGNMAKAAREWSKEIKQSLGLNDIEVRKVSATFYVMLKSMGVAEDAAFEMSKQLTLLGYDLASFYDLSTDDAFLKLQAGITGETEPLKQLGVVLTENALKQYGYNTSMSEAEKITTRYQAILQQTVAAQGDLGRTLDSPTNRVRVLKSKLELLGTTIGTGFLDLVSNWSERIQSLVGKIQKWVEANPELTATIGTLAVGFGAIAAALGPVLFGIGQLVPIFAALAPAVGALLSPWGLLAAGIATAAVSLIDWGDAWAKTKQWVSSDLGGIANTFADFLAKITNTTEDATTKTTEALEETGDKWGAFREKMGGIFAGLAGNLAEYTGGMDKMDKDTADIFEKNGMKWDAFKIRIMAVWKNLKEAFSASWTDFKSVLENQWNAIMEGFAGVINVIYGEWTAAWANFSGAVDLAVVNVMEALSRLANILPMSGSGSVTDRLLLLPSHFIEGFMNGGGSASANNGSMAGGGAVAQGGGGGGVVVNVNVSGTGGESAESFASRVAGAVRDGARLGLLQAGAF